MAVPALVHGPIFKIAHEADQLFDGFLEGLTPFFRGSQFGVAEHSGLSPDDVIERFTSVTYRVYMLGFLPGFAYMGTVDESIAVRRRDSPRSNVPKGSVAIASRQAGIYPFESPGGWQIIGHTDLEMFRPESDPPCTLMAGDEVQFVRIS